MNLFVRFFWCWVQIKNKKHAVDVLIKQHFRIWPHDMGWRLHLPNFRFLSFMELGRFHYWYGVKSELKRASGSRLIAAQDMVYIRPVSFLAKLDMATYALGWDEKYVYFKHDFYVGKSLVATGLVKEACVANGAVISPNDIFCGETPQETGSLLESWRVMQAEVKALSDPR
jgi:acyl-CoA thioesterase FadM